MQVADQQAHLFGLVAAPDRVRGIIKITMAKVTAQLLVAVAVLDIFKHAR
jgi:hypothetical protein